MNFNNAQQQKIVELFRSLNSSEIQYVIPRGHKKLPNQTSGGDIDFIIKSDDFEKATEIAKKRGFNQRTTGRSTASRIQSLANLGKKAINRPQTAVSRIYYSPENVINKITRSVSKKGRGSVLDWRAYNGDIMIHFRNHLAYESPLDSGEYRVDPIVEEELFEYRQKSGGVYIPSPPDEMVHLICRGVFDRNGDFPDYYVERCSELFNNLTDDENERFRKLLSHIFFKADELVYQHIIDEKYSDILQSLRAYSDY